MLLQWVGIRCLIVWAGVLILNFTAANASRGLRLANVFKPVFGTATGVFSWRKTKVRGEPAHIIRWKLGSLADLPWNVSSVTEPSQAHVCLRPAPNGGNRHKPPAIVDKVQWYEDFPMTETRPTLDVVPNVALDFISSGNKTRQKRVSLPLLTPLMDSVSWYCTTLPPCTLWSALVRDKRLDIAPGVSSSNNIDLTSTHLNVVVLGNNKTEWKRTELVFFLGYHLRVWRSLVVPSDTMNEKSHLMEIPTFTAEKEHYAKEHLDSDEELDDTGPNPAAGMFAHDMQISENLKNTSSLDLLLRDAANTSMQSPATTTLATGISDRWQRKWLEGFPLLTAFPFSVHPSGCDSTACDMFAGNTLNFLEPVEQHPVILDITTNRPYCDVSKKRRGVAVLLVTNSSSLNPLRGVMYVPRGWAVSNHEVRFSRTYVPSVMAVRSAFNNTRIFDQVNHKLESPSAEVPGEHTTTTTIRISGNATKANASTTTASPDALSTASIATSHTSQPAVETSLIPSTATTDKTAPMNTWLIMTSAGALSCGLGGAALYAYWYFFKRPSDVGDSVFDLDLDESQP